MNNTGHGHVFPREDGVKARCGGPGICNECSADLAKKQNVAQLGDHRPHIVAKALCLNVVWELDSDAKAPCLTQWIATCPAETPLTKLECPECGAQNSFAVEIGRRIAEKKPMIGEIDGDD